MFLAVETPEDHMSFYFTPPVDPKKPLDAADPPPKDWQYVDAHEHRKALFWRPSAEFLACIEWEKRELARIEKSGKRDAAVGCEDGRMPHNPWKTAFERSFFFCSSSFYKGSV